MITKITVLYDARCAFCRACREWIIRQNLLIPIEFLDRNHPDVIKIYGDYCQNGLQDTMVAIDDQGGLYFKEDAYIMILYCLRDWRKWAGVIAKRGLKSHARSFFELIARNRQLLSGFVS